MLRGILQTRSLPTPIVIRVMVDYAGYPLVMQECGKFLADTNKKR